eukprot:Skav228785  [mRNA]  locus=scaffold589:659540:661329:- [translate_table: standard]
MGAMPWIWLAVALVRDCVAQASTSSNSPSETIDSFSSFTWESNCLPNAVQRPRRNLLSTSGEFPIGIYNSADVRFHNGQVDAPTAIFTILAEEVLGYQVKIVSDWAGHPSSIQTDALHALGGCQRNTESVWICGGHGGRRTTVHVALALTMEEDVQQVFDDLQRLRVGGLLEDLGDMGYVVRQGVYVKGDVALRAQADRVFLDDARTFNAAQRDFFNLTRYFSSVEEIRANFIPCEGWIFTQEDLMSYPSLVSSTGNDTGLIISNFTRQIATRLNMPIALGALVGHTFGSPFYETVITYDVLYFYWEPDVTFRSLNPLLIAPLDAGVQEPHVVVSSSLEWLAPDARVLLDNMQFNLASIYEMMSYDVLFDAVALANSYANQLLNGTDILALATPNQWFAGGDVFEGACTWLQSNVAKWKSWIPSKTSCMPGQGLFLNAAWHVT